jgi:hypothetical protein
MSTGSAGCASVWPPECGRVVQRGDLGDHPADADARQVRRPVVESAGKGRGVGGKIAQRVRRSLGIDGRRGAGIACVYSRSVLGRPKCGKTLVSGKPVMAATRPPRSVRTMRP